MLLGLALIQLLHKGERTLRKVNERYTAEPLAIGRTLGLCQFRETC